MRFIMKTDYYQDIRLFKYRSTFFWYLALVIGACLLPAVADDYIISQFAFIAMYSIATVGLMLLTGYTGQVSMGHAAFFGIGAYTSAILTTKGVPFLLALPAAGLLAGVVGIFIGLPALRLSGLYLAIATMGFGFIVEEVLVRWEHLTRGKGLDIGRRPCPAYWRGYGVLRRSSWGQRPATVTVRRRGSSKRATERSPQAGMIP